MARKAFFEEMIFEQSSEQNEEAGHEKIRGKHSRQREKRPKQKPCRWNKMGVFEDKQEVGRGGTGSW